MANLNKLNSGNVAKMSDKDIDDTLKKLKGQIAKAEFEARFTGDYSYFKKLKSKWGEIEKERKSR